LRRLQSLTTCRPPHRPFGLQSGATDSHEVSHSYSTSHLQSPLTRGLPHLVRSTFRVSHPLGGLLLCRLPGLVSCQCALGVAPFKAFPSARSCGASRHHFAFLTFTSCSASRPPMGGSCRSIGATHAALCRRSRQPVSPVHELSRHPNSSCVFKALLPEMSPLYRTRPLSLVQTRCSPGIASSQAVRHLHRSKTLPPHLPPSSRSRLLPSSLPHSPKVMLSLARMLTPRRFNSAGARLTHAWRSVLPTHGSLTSSTSFSIWELPQPGL
jgi:hypothetical protein